MRSVFVIGPDKKVKLTLTYPASTGRNFDEILRVLDSLQLTASHEVATPADWQQGDDVIIMPAVSEEEAARASPSDRVIKPYLRLPPSPGELIRHGGPPPLDLRHPATMRREGRRACAHPAGRGSSSGVARRLRHSTACQRRRANRRKSTARRPTPERRP